MIEQERPDAFGHTIVCDDIRQEISGKLIFIGAYTQGIMVIHGDLPFTLPQLCFAISLSQKKETFSPSVKIRIFVPGDAEDAPSIEGEIGERVDGGMHEEANHNAEQLSIPKSERKYLNLFATMQFTGFQIREEGLLKVRADIGDKRYDIGGIRISRSQKRD